jgi:hypothetical protein
VRAGAIDGKRPPAVMVDVELIQLTSLCPSLEKVNLSGVFV